MIIDKSTEKQTVSEEVKGERQSAPAKWVEMGQVSVETKGIARGVELGWTPKS